MEHAKILICLVALMLPFSQCHQEKPIPEKTIQEFKKHYEPKQSDTPNEPSSNFVYEAHAKAL